jgi:hypothetical protein
VSSRRVLGQIAVVAAVVVLLAATGAVSYRMRNAHPRPAVLYSDGSMTLSPTSVRPGQRLQARFTTHRIRTGLLSATGPSGSFLLAAGRLVRIPANGQLRLTVNEARVHPRASALSFTSRVPIALPEGHYRVCSVNEPGGASPIAECARLTVL